MRGAPEGFETYWSNGQWRVNTHAALKRLLTPESTFVDVGAWVGPVVLWAAPLCRRVLALEPDPVAFDALVANTINLDNVAPVRMAMGETTGTQSLYHRGAFGESMSTLVPTGESDPTDVTVVSPTDFITTWGIEPPALFNVNIEGSEALVLPTLAPLLVRRGIPLILSVHLPWAGPDGAKRIDAALALFDTVEKLQEDGPGFYEVLAIPGRD